MAHRVVPATDQRSIRQLFDAIAPRYDFMNSLMSLGRDQWWRRMVVQRSGLEKGGCGLDVCCGTGRLTMELAKAAGRTGRVVGLDFSARMLAVAQKQLKAFPAGNTIRLILGDASRLPFADQTFDCATIGWGLRNVPDVWSALGEMIRVVRPGGKVISIDMGQPRLPGLKGLYWFCFEKCIPPLGGLGAGDQAAYAYLYSSARAFPRPGGLAQLFGRAGLIQTAYNDLCGGVVAVVEGRKLPER